MYSRKLDRFIDVAVFVPLLWTNPDLKIIYAKNVIWGLPHIEPVIIYIVKTHLTATFDSKIWHVNGP
jgi:hypothetical protein